MSSRKYYITEFGAKPNIEFVTEQIQATIDACYMDGGGKVVIPKGDFYTGGIRLRSGVTLYLEKDAHLIGSRNVQDYFCVQNDKLQPLDAEDRCDTKWLPMDERTSFDHINKCGTSWNNALIRAVDADDIAIIGEEGSYIDGRDCFDETGEEYYRGPHAINFHRCENIKLIGYTIKNSGNWAHMLFSSKNISVQNIEVHGGHDGIHSRMCTNATIRNCKFYTGDDCVAGHGNLNYLITDCLFNTACSGMRFGGTNIIVDNCKFTGPAKYIFRGSLSDEEKRSGVTSEVDSNHRYNMLSAFTYFSDFSMDIPFMPGNIIIKNCEIENTDRFVHYNFSGNEPWQCNKALRDITFENIKATGIKMPLNLYGSKDVPLLVNMKNVDISFANVNTKMPFIRTFGFEKIVLDNVNIHNHSITSLVKAWDEGGEIVFNNVTHNCPKVQERELASDAFICDAI